MSVELKSVSKTDMSVMDNPAFSDDTHIVKEETKLEMQLKDTPPENDPTDQDDDFQGNCCTRATHTCNVSVHRFYVNHRRKIVSTVKIVLALLYFAYFTYAIYYAFGDEGSIRLLVVSTLAISLIVGKSLISIYETQLDALWEKKIKPTVKTGGFRKLMTTISWFLKIATFVVLGAVTIEDVLIDYPQNLISIAGLVLCLFLFYIFSTNPARVNWHTVFWGMALQYIFALIIMRTYWGFQTFKWIGDRVNEFLQYADEGAIFLFGQNFEEHFVAFKVLSIAVFAFTVISVLYYIGVMQFIVRNLGRFLAFCMGTSPAESVATAANIFVGMIDAPLMIKPFLKDMTKSELHVVMTGGFATIAGSVLGAYISFGIPANHLMSASVMSAPAALALSKLSYPETKVKKSSPADFYRMEKSKERNVIEVISTSATASIKIVSAIAVNVLAFLSILKAVNVTLDWFGERVGLKHLSFQFICSYVFFPIAYFMGTDISDCRTIAELIGIKTFTNEFVAYFELSKLIKNKQSFVDYTEVKNLTDWFYNADDIVLPAMNQTLVKGIISNKSEIIATYALCGFSNFGSIGILLGAMTALVPSRKSDVSVLVLRAMIVGNFACFLTACIAGLLYKDYE